MGPLERRDTLYGHKFPLANIADLMGHQDLATTQIYAKVEMEHLREAVGQLAGLVPEEMTLKNDTRDVFEAGASRKLLKTGDLEEWHSGVVGTQGFEPRFYGPEPHVLPLDDVPTG